jgi:hypothetical protein
MDMATMEKKIDELMKENHIMGEVVEEREDRNMIGVEVIWGDWKHEHLKLDWLMEENFPDLRRKYAVTTEDNGTDNYSAIHYYYFN